MLFGLFKLPIGSIISPCLQSDPNRYRNEHFSLTDCGQYESGGEAQLFAQFPAVAVRGHEVDWNPVESDARVGEDHVHQNVVERCANLKQLVLSIRVVLRASSWKKIQKCKVSRVSKQNHCAKLLSTSHFFNQTSKEALFTKLITHLFCSSYFCYKIPLRKIHFKGF